jgi:hypothetical protein
MFEGWEELVKNSSRIADALERIAEATNGGDPHVDAAIAKAKYRDGLKARLDAAGIKYVSKAKTSTLEKLVAEVEANGATPAPVPEPPNTAPPAPPAPVMETLTKEDLRDALVDLSAAKGKDVALRILARYAPKLGEVPVEQYPALMAELKEARNGR